MDFENEVSRKFLIQVLEFLAEDPDDQVREFPESPDVPELLTLLWHDSFEENRGVFEAGLVSPPQLERLRDLDGVFGRICAPGRTEVWTNAALEQTEDWDQVRGIARDLLKSLNGSSPSTTAKTP